jgi:hypothetical protein
MSSNTRAAEAVQVAPYLTHVVSHHGRPTLIPPDNAGRRRHTSKQGRKEKKSIKKNGDRSVRSEDNEETRFNLGAPRAARTVTSGPSARRRPGRTQDESRLRNQEGCGYGEGAVVYFDKTR